jgi:hypothetical protein
MLREDQEGTVLEFLGKYGMAGTEVYMNEIYPRVGSLFDGENNKEKWIEECEALGVKRIHCSYWAYPTYFLTRTNYREFLRRMDGYTGVRRYYGDLTGDHIYERWVQEYDLASSLNAQCFVFHLIDYAAIDGAWEFTISREEILQAMAGMLQTLLIRLDDEGLLGENSPFIEVENAGWGLEYGAQRAEDFAFIFGQLYDPHGKVKIGWDMNHLLHATGKGADGKGARFMLPDYEITEEMAEIESKYGYDSAEFSAKWLESNILNPLTIERVNALQLADCALKSDEYFRNGRLLSVYREKIDSIPDGAAKSDYGVSIVLNHYDSHIPMGKGVLTVDSVKRMIERLATLNDDFVLLHELKNSKLLQNDLETQLAFLERCGCR